MENLTHHYSHARAERLAGDRDAKIKTVYKASKSFLDHVEHRTSRPDGGLGSGTALCRSGVGSRGASVGRPSLLNRPAFLGRGFFAERCFSDRFFAGLLLASGKRAIACRLLQLLTK
jgi:hypothetical protein